MRILITAVLGLASLFFAWRGVGAALLNEPFEKTYPLRAGGELQLRNVNGAVTVEAWDKNEVRVEAQKKVKGNSDEAARKAMEETRIEVSETAGRLEIATRHPKRDAFGHDGRDGRDGHDGHDGHVGNEVNVSVEYKIWVPRGARLDLENVNGALHVEGVKGDLNLESTNGGIQVAGAGGAVHAATTNGSIDVKLADVPEGSDLSFSTTNGGVVVQLPRDSRATVDATTSNGRVSSDFEVAGDTKSRRKMEGEINGGGGSLKIRTTNGSIHIVEG